VVSKGSELSLFKLLLAPLGMAVLLFSLTYGAGFDFTVASVLYEVQGNSWLLKHHWLTEQVLHRHLRTLNEIVVLSLLGYWLWRRFVFKDNSKKLQALGLLLLSLLLSFVTVAVIKRLVPMECPWDLNQFGGHSAFWGLFATRPDHITATQCFPAGHASIGFAWLALFYYWREMKPQQALFGLMIGGCAGLLLGFVQQLRGAHFISHDIATAAICWLIATVLYLWFKAKTRSTEQPQSRIPSPSFHSLESPDV
jgi:membrane-associated PAP2 superfamily phosphatase